ncbi:NtaA/DmoA family FMN-dependent monooxygenase [Pseudonocardia broussonetiae]|uniref:NtaA/DmoA family FMN-dependent monooxygenase n=1 Tax=Pseudonocardia broussonetiae TaxID=2736640 RepID=A0A6M6JRA1_9PSEU|nr:NtaA/DmoA family FMN-dependent monooxygenase [Pseudonocardia broussonetiae]QJY49172.1 NtaA/DmoA family FMN-dependent monooxygenase [Pseudonocardia broussonetiae]
MPRQLKLGAVLFGVGGPGDHDTWRHPEVPLDASTDIRWYVERARQAEAALFDLVFIVDSQFITPDSPPHYLNRLEPLTLLSAVAVQTERIGLVGTLTTSYNSPFNLARRLGSLDLISGGRAGWNVVATGDGGTAANYSRDEHYDYAARYGRALESVRVCQGLWDSYEDDAFAVDKAAEEFVDPSRLHRLDHSGEHFSSVRGPLNISRSPQGRPVIFQAGDSEEGRDLGAEIGEGIFTHAPTLEAGVAFARDIRARAQAKGRDPRHVVVMPGITPVVADTDEEALAIEEARRRDRFERDFPKTLAQFGRPFGWHDFSGYDLDAPFPELGDLGSTSFRTQAERIKAVARDEGLTLRETVLRFTASTPAPFVGSARTVADRIQEWFEAGALDGLNVHVTVPSEFARFTDGVLPLLRARGVVRDAYDSTTLRGHLGLPVPENVHTAARATARPLVPTP